MDEADPWSAAGALSGFFARRRSRTRGPAADEGVRPTELSAN